MGSMYTLRVGTVCSMLFDGHLHTLTFGDMKEKPSDDKNKKSRQTLKTESGLTDHLFVLKIVTSDNLWVESGKTEALS